MITFFVSINNIEIEISNIWEKIFSLELRSLMLEGDEMFDWERLESLLSDIHCDDKKSERVTPPPSESVNNLQQTIQSESPLS